MTASGIVGQLDVPAVAWWSERAVPALLVAEVGASVVPLEPLVGLSTVLGVGVLALAMMLRLNRAQHRLFPDRREAGTLARESNLGRRLREGGYVAPEERTRAGRIAWSALVATAISCWASLVFAGAVLVALADDAVTSLDGAVGVVVLVAGLGVLATQIRDSAHWRHIATDRFAVRAPVPA